MRVAVTGLGVISPLGNNLSEFSSKIFEGASGIGPITQIPCKHFPTQLGAEINNFECVYRDRKIDYALTASSEAMAQAFGTSLEYRNHRCALSLGLGLELFSVEDLQTALDGNCTPDFFKVTTPADLCVPLICKKYQFNRHPFVHQAACAASTDAIGNAFREISSGRLDMVLAGGADSMINLMGFSGFSRLGALSSRNTADTSRPFDIDRDGFVMGEGSGFLVLESEKLANSRGAEILAWVSGYGNSLDAYNLSDPHPNGDGAHLAMTRAVSSSQFSVSDISAINVHGTSTPKNDPAESKAIRRLLGNHWENVFVFATKSMIGHLISAAGAVESVAVVECLRNQKLHPRINTKNIDPDCELNHVLEQTVSTELKHILKNSFGFGGLNACLMFSSNVVT